MVRYSAVTLIYRRFIVLSVSSVSDCAQGDLRLSQITPSSQGNCTPPNPIAFDSLSTAAFGSFSEVVLNHILTVKPTSPPSHALVISSYVRYGNVALSGTADAAYEVMMPSKND